MAGRGNRNGTFKEVIGNKECLSQFRSPMVPGRVQIAC